jgi:hypothetical protein
MSSNRPGAVVVVVDSRPGRCAQGTGALDKAIISYYRALDFNPNLLGVHNNLGAHGLFADRFDACDERLRGYSGADRKPRPRDFGRAGGLLAR